MQDEDGFMRSVGCSKRDPDHLTGFSHDPVCPRASGDARAVTPSTSDRTDLYRFWDIPDVAWVDPVIPAEQSIRLKKLYGDDRVE